MSAALPVSAKTRLPPLETALLWSIRHWVAGYRAGVDAERGIDRVFAEMGARDARSYLSGLMWVVANAACRRLAIACPCSRSVTEDERSLLEVVALTQERQHFERLLLLRTFLRPMASAPAGQSAAGLVRICNRAGLFFHPVCPTTRLDGLPLASPLPVGFDAT